MSTPTRIQPPTSTHLTASPSPLARVSRIDARRLEVALVVALIALAALVYTLFALRIGGFQPDEWYFTELARMIAHDFPAALWRSGVYLRGIERIDQLVLAIPYALLHTPASYEVAHVLQAVLYASTALPVWLLGRAAGLGRATRTLAAALVLLAPWAILSTSFLAEPAAYPAFAWVLCTSYYAAARPSRKVEVLALVALVVAALSRTQLLALAPVLPLAVLWQAWRCELAGTPRGARLRALPMHLWRAHPIVTAVTLLGIVLIIVSAAGVLPGGGVARLAGAYGLPRLEAFSAIIGRDRYYASRAATGTGVLALVFGAAWVLRTLARAREAASHALAVVCALGIGGLALSLVNAGTDERYMFYAAIPIALAFAGELDSRLRDGRPSTGDAVAVAVGALAVILLVESVTWPSSAQPYDYLTFTAGVFYGKVVLGRLGSVHVPLLHPSAETLVQIGTAVVAAAWIATAYRSRLRRPAAVTLGAAVLAICGIELYYTLHKFTSSAAAVPGGPSAHARSWVDRSVPAGTRVGQLGIGLGVTSYAAIWRDLDFWNTSVRVAVALQSTGMPPVPLDGGGAELTISSPSGELHTVPSGALEQTIPRYLLVPLQGTNPVEVEGTVIGHDPLLPVELIRAHQPARVAWQVARTSPEGFMAPDLPAIATVYSGALAGGDRCASFTLLAAPGFAGRWPYVVRGDGTAVASGTLAAQQRRVITVPLARVASDGGRLASFTVAVQGHVLYANGSVVSGQIAFFSVGRCPRSLH